MSPPIAAAVEACTPWQEVLSASVDGETDDLEEHRLRSHLRRCARCSASHAALVDLRAATLGGSPAVPAGLVAEITGARRARQARRRAGSAVAVVLVVLLALGAAIDLGTGRHDDVAAGPRGARVELLDEVADRDVVEVDAGATVTWENIGSTTHRLVREGATATTTDEVRPGQSGATTYARPGTYAFHCSIHPAVRGRVEVTS